MALSTGGGAFLPLGAFSAARSRLRLISAFDSITCTIPWDVVAPDSTDEAAALQMSGIFVSKNHSNQKDAPLMDRDQNVTTFQIIQPGGEIGIVMCAMTMGSIHSTGIEPTPRQTPNTQGGCPEE